MDMSASSESEKSEGFCDEEEEEEEDDLDYYAADFEEEENDAGCDIREANDPEAYEYKCLTAEECYHLLEGQVTTASNEMQVPSNHMWMVLNQHKWSLDNLTKKYAKRTQQMLVDARVIPSKKSLVPVHSQCGVCFSSMTTSDLCEMPCGHDFCRSCWREHIQSKIAVGVANDIECMQCDVLIGREMALSLIRDSDEWHLKYKKYSLADFVVRHQALRWCPGVDCTCVISVEKSCAKRVICSNCNAQFCFNCGSAYHAPTGCDTMSAWLKKCHDDSETLNYIQANTKPCPKCNIPIEKSGGCNHLRCSTCSHDFCWMCLKSWDTHSGEYYTCSKYTHDAARESSANAAKLALKRYCHYYERWANHQKSLHLEKETLQRIHRHIEDMIATQQGTWIDWQHLIDGAAVLAKSRYTLQYTYPYAYFTTDVSKELFEYQQGQLEKEIEALSFTIEHSTFSDRATIQSKMLSVEQWRSTLLTNFLA